MKTSTASHSAASAAEKLASELAQQMQQRWREGEQVGTEYFLSAKPELRQQPQVALELIYEEYCLRQAAGHENVEQEILGRYPHWAAQLRVMLDCHRLLEACGEQATFPSVGERVGEFRLHGEIARGARGKVFLATQSGLGERLMVLKITPLEGAEHISLARLQHTNIVPLYSMIDEAARNVRVLCMPYFGRGTLAAILAALANVPIMQRSGSDIVRVVDQAGEDAGAIADGAARQMLSHVSYMQAMCWISASLADALQFAHERGLVHLDIKPSNILITRDGQPMLLDFHLAREPIRPGGPLPENLGGTPPYMAPEQLAAMKSIQEAKPADAAVDGRADIYALGAVLYEALAGRPPLSTQPQPLSRFNPQVSAGLSDIVARCLASRPELRYADAQSLADDLRRHLADQPLAGVPNRSVAERWHKWRRRRPSAVRAAGMILIGAAAVLVVAGSMWSHVHHRHELAELALEEAGRQMERAAGSAQAVATMERGLKLIENMPFQSDLRRQLQDQLATARQRHLRHQVHQLAEEVRALYCSLDSIPVTKLGSLAAQCENFWEKRQTIVDSIAPSRDATAAADLKDIAIFAAALHARLRPDATGRAEALRILDEAVTLFGPSAILEHERQAYRPPTQGVLSPASNIKAASVWEHCALGRAFLLRGDLQGAQREFKSALQREPAGLWPNFYSGICAYQMRRYDDAVAAFSLCIGAAPGDGGCYYNRALAHAALGHIEQALADYDSALRLDPANAAAAANRRMLQIPARAPTFRN